MTWLSQSRGQFVFSNDNVYSIVLCSCRYLVFIFPLLFLFFYFFFVFGIEIFFWRNNDQKFLTSMSNLTSKGIITQPQITIAITTPPHVFIHIFVPTTNVRHKNNSTKREIPCLDQNHHQRGEGLGVQILSIFLGGVICMATLV